MVDWKGFLRYADCMGYTCKGDFPSGIGKNPAQRVYRYTGYLGMCALPLRSSFDLGCRLADALDGIVGQSAGRVAGAGGNK